MNQENIKFRQNLLLSMQNALLGMIYPSIRAIVVGFRDMETLKVVVYLDKEPSEDDLENLSEITTEVLADIDFNRTEEICLRYTGPLSKIDVLDSCVYMRKE